jgi:hypothetical protein
MLDLSACQYRWIYLMTATQVHARCSRRVRTANASAKDRQQAITALAAIIHIGGRGNQDRSADPARGSN